MDHPPAENVVGRIVGTGHDPSTAPGPAGRPPLRSALAALHVDALQWSLGLFCAFLGAFLLVASHQFATAAYVGFLAHPAIWGLAALAAGVALLALPTLRAERRIAAVVHGLVGLILLLLAGGFWSSGAVSGGVVYTLLGLGTLAAPLLPRARGLGPPEPAGDLLSLLLGAATAVIGLLLVVAPDHFPAVQALGASGPLALGAWWLVSGPLLVGAQLGRVPPRPAAVVHLAAGTVLVAFGLTVSAPGRAWTGVALYSGIGLVIATLPWLRRRLAAADPAALRTRFALALALVASLALILAVAVVTFQEERLAVYQFNETQRREARAVAQNVADYLDFNVARVTAIAASAALESTAGDSRQEAFLAATARVHPDVTAFALVDGSGAVTARSSRFPFPPPLARALAQETSGDRVVLRFVEIAHDRLILLCAAVPGARQPSHGALVAVLGTESLRRRLARSGSRVVLADGGERIIAEVDETALPAELFPREDAVRHGLPAGWDRAVVAGRTPVAGDGLAAYAAVPEVGWAVAVERPRSAALAGVRRGRELAFVLLLVLVALAAIAGVVIARRIARPLDALTRAVDALSVGALPAPVPASGIDEIARLETAFRDLRDRLAVRTAESERLAQELLARAEALAEADRRKDEFLAMLAHELRNPLGAIANASSVLEHLTSETPAVERAVQVIQRQNRHLVRMVDDLLDVSRITRGKVELRRERLDLVDVVQHAIETTRPALEARRHELRLALPEGPIVLDADRTRLEQVVSNLLRNAAQYTPPGGRIEVTVSCQGGAAVVSVRDNGMGIGPELLAHVFDLFAQGEQPLDRGGAGLGIGLTLVRRLVELHGGQVEAVSAGPGRGAELTVRLPLG